MEDVDKMGKNKNVSYNEISSCSLSEELDVVVSSFSEGGYTMAQKLMTTDAEGNEAKVFLKGAIHFHDLECLYKLRNMINEAIRTIEEEKAKNLDEEWD